MKTTMRNVALALAALAWSAPARAQFQDARVQAPALAAPARGSISGPLAHVAFGAADVERGAFSLPLPLPLPTDRGALDASFLPSYSPEAAQGEWGMGWSAKLSLTRFRATGDLTFDDGDDLASPWGTLTRASDGSYLVRGLQTRVRVVAQGDAFVATLEDGSRWTFGTRDASSRGTYAWYLDEVQTVLGRVTHFAYTPNATGRFFLSSVTYGGPAGAPQHQVVLEYASIATPIVDYRSGDRRTLDRRVTGVVAQSLVAGTFATRYRYDLAYENDRFGPAFYLASVARTFASGDREPALTYGYAHAADRFPTAAARHVAKLDALITLKGLPFLAPAGSGVLDVDLDGRPDLEATDDQTLWRQTDDGFIATPLAPAPASANVLCRPAPRTAFSPRNLVELRADDAASYVVTTTNPRSNAETLVTVCDRDGSTLLETTLAGAFRLGPNVRLADVTRDRQPDLIRLEIGRVTVLPNISTAAALGFGAPVVTTLSPAVTADLLIVHDINGDALPDLVSQGDGSARVWYGRGQGKFSETSDVFAARNSVGGSVSGLRKSNVVYADVNQDGLADLLVGSGNAATLYLNNGAGFIYAAVPAFQKSNTSRPFFIDFAGSGESEVAFLAVSDAQSIALTEPASGLLVHADDGRGNALSFTYARADAAPGIRNRPSLVSNLRIDTTGAESTTYEYAYAGAHLHTRGQFLVGFDHVVRRAPLAQDSLTLWNDDDTSGLLLASATHDDLEPGAEKVTSRAYDDVTSFGLPWKRLRSESTGWQSTDPLAPRALLATTDYLAYEREVCPTLTQKKDVHGTLTTTRTLVSLAAFDGSLACLGGGTILTGSHDDPSLDFRHEATFERNDQGQLTRLVLHDPLGGPRVAQDIAYTPDGLVASVASPGRGVTLAEYAPGTRLLARVTQPDGVVREVVERDPLTDALRSVVERRGSLSVLTTFRFDGRERLAKNWNDLGHASQARPSMSVAYRDADATRPALLQLATLVDGLAGVTAQRAELSTAAGDSIVSADRIPEGWSLGVIHQQLASTRTAVARRRRPVQDIAALDAATLFASADFVGRTQAATFGGAASSAEKLHADVERDVQSDFAFDGTGALVRSSVENATYVTRTELDADLHPRAVTDAGGARTALKYDALGRVRRAILADGASHSVTFDGYGLPARVERTGVATLLYRYDPESGLVTEKTFTSPAGEAARRIGYRYDGVGRLISETHTALPDGASQSFAYFYDGATPEAPALRATPGLLTAVTGDRYSRHVTYRGDGRPVTVRVDLGAWRQVEDSLQYGDDDGVSGTTRVVRDGATQEELLRVSSSVTRDAYGRSSGQTLDGSTLATVAYDLDGLPAWAQFSSGGVASGEIATFQHDPLTRARVGLNLHNAQWSAAVSQRMNARGFVGAEDFAVGAEKRHRNYTYASAGYLASSTDAADQFAYAYDASGLPQRTTSTADGVTIDETSVRSGVTLTSGNHHHTFDAIGRAVERDAVTLTYGPLGQVASATNGVDSWSYLYDEAGQRVAKVSLDGLFRSGYLGDSYLDATSLTTPVRVAGALVGLIRHTREGATTRSAFSLVFADSRGTVLADADGTMKMPSPFGARTTHPDVAAAVDFASKGWDPDLGVVRMGVRDYDPSMGRWLQPDPLYLEEPARIAARPVDGALYAYAMNDPLRLVDPQGTQESPAAQHYIDWRDKETAAGHSEQVEQMDAFRAKGAAASAAAGAAVALAAEPAIGTEIGIQTWGALQRLGAWGRAALVTLGVLKETRPAPVDASAASTAIAKYWPPNSGFAGNPTETTLKAGTLIDRFGAETGTYASPAGMPFPLRALPPSAADAPYNVYQVLKPLPVQAGTIAPAFGQIGNGIQYILPRSVVALIEEGYLGRKP
jgi:RHS repeat-associated protein